MKLKKLRIRNFRNITDLEYEPGPHLNFLIGQNAQGKTSVLESLSFLATLRSFRGSQAIEVLQWKQPFGSIAGEITDEDWTTELSIEFQSADTLHKKATKRAFINKKLYSSSLKYLSQRFSSSSLGFHTIVFNPSDHELIRGEPSLRRQFLNQAIAAEDFDYLRILKKYQRTLEQRNSLLKDADRTPQEVLLGFTEQLVEMGSALTWKRMHWLDRMSAHIQQVITQIAPSQTPLGVSYDSKWLILHEKKQNYLSDSSKITSIYFTGQGDIPSLKQIEQKFWQALSTVQLAERRAKTSLVGPHRDDWMFHVQGQPVKGHGSQGEVRSVLLSLKLSELKLFQEATGVRPVFLLDDFSSELDHQRRRFLLDYLMKTELQVFVTSTENLFSVGNQVEVQNGSIVS